MQKQRIELKFIIEDELVEPMRDYLKAYLVLDRYGALQADKMYPVHSLYLDSPDKKLFQSTINGDRNRFKLRVRYYEDRPEAPVYFEIKARDDNGIYKRRCAIRREAVRDMATGRLPDRRDLSGYSMDDEAALIAFCRHLNQLQAQPTAHVYYRREAWASHCPNRYRVTFDRKVMIAPEYTFSFATEHSDAVSVFGNKVVLELKFADRFPLWMRDMVRIFGLQAGSAAKYVDGLIRLQGHRAGRVRMF